MGHCVYLRAGFLAMGKGLVTASFTEVVKCYGGLAFKNTQHGHYYCNCNSITCHSGTQLLPPVEGLSSSQSYSLPSGWCLEGKEFWPIWFLVPAALCTG